jgi:hypothetical protein
LSESASEIYPPSDRRLSVKWLLTFADGGCHVVSVTDPYGRILGFLDRSRYTFLSSSSSVVLNEAEWHRSRQTTFFPGCAGNRTRASGSVAKNFKLHMLRDKGRCQNLSRGGMIRIIPMLHSDMGPKYVRNPKCSVYSFSFPAISHKSTCLVL